MKLRQRLGIIAFWCAWPAFYVYLRRSERTRVLVVWDNRILATANWISDGRWSFPGGGLHKGEAAKAGAIRELYEETGIRIEARQLHFLGKGMYIWRGLSYPFHCFVVKLTGEPTLRRQWIEVADIRWFTIEELLARRVAAEVPGCLRMLEDSPYHI